MFGTPNGTPNCMETSASSNRSVRKYNPCVFLVNLPVSISSQIVFWCYIILWKTKDEKVRSTQYELPPCSNGQAHKIFTPPPCTATHFDHWASQPWHPQISHRVSSFVCPRKQWQPVHTWVFFGNLDVLNSTARNARPSQNWDPRHIRPSLRGLIFHVCTDL